MLWLTGKTNPDGTRSPYEINVTYLDALSSQHSEDRTRIARFILAHAVLLSFPGVPAIYIQSILGSRNDYKGVEKLGYNRAINRKKHIAERIDEELQDNTSLRHKNISRAEQVDCIASSRKGISS